MRSTVFFASFSLVLAVSAAVGCAAGGGNNGSGFGGSGGSGGSSDGGAGGQLPGSGGTGGSNEGGFNPTGTGGGGGSTLPAEVFAEGPDTLYKLDPVTKQFTKIGKFDGNDSAGIIDIAIDKDGIMYGTSTGSLWLIDKTTAHCTKVADGNYPNSLSLVPKGTVDATTEALVGYVGSDYVRIDKMTGAVSTIGSLGGSGYQSSGDIVSVIGGGTYLTVKGNDCADCIVEVNPKTGAMSKMIGPLGHESVFGLAFWAGSAYGFDDFGELFEVDLTTGQTTPLTPGGFDVPQFWGAGSTTAAPVMPPK